MVKKNRMDEVFRRAMGGGEADWIGGVVGVKICGFLGGGTGIIRTFGVVR